MSKNAAQGGAIVFVNPPYERIAPGYGFVRHVSNRSPSLGLLYLAAVTRELGYATTIIESDIEELGAEQVIRRIVQQRPRYVGMTLFTVGVWHAALIAQRVKQLLPDTVVIVGGPHVSSMGMETMRRFPQFDVAVLHEGEHVLPELLSRLDAHGDLNEVSGILFRSGEAIVRTPPAAAIADLDALPLPAWDLLPGFPQAYRPAIFQYPRGPVATLAASRGCPFLCKFCDTSTFGAKVRAYSPAAVFAMMKHLKDNYGIRHIQFVDDLFLASRIRTLALCDLIIAKRLDISWSCTARVDTVKPDVLQRMRQAGCWEISFGLETGSDALLQQMEKAARVAVSEQAVRWTAQAGIRCKGLFMLGYPGETADTVAATKAFVRRIPMATMNLSKFTPYPGSPIYRELYGTAIRDEHWQKMNGMNFIWVPESLGIETLDREYRNILVSFYRQRRVIRRYAAMSIRHPAHLLRLLRFGIGFCAAKWRSYRNGRHGALLERNEEETQDKVWRNCSRSTDFMGLKDL
ncbi:MAG: B12-binding domain-containing radical SAM protein [Gammaproteobacteria bacterium]